MVLLSASKVWLLVQRDDGIWSFLIWTRNHLSLQHHPEMSREVVEETLLILQENQRDFLLELDDPLSRWMFSGLDLLQEVWFVHLWLENSIFFGKYHLFRMESFSSRFPMRPSSPTPQGLQPVRHPSKIHPRTIRIPGTIKVRLSFPLMDSWLVFRRNRVILNQWTKRNDRSFKWLPKTSFVWSFPIR